MIEQPRSHRFYSGLAVLDRAVGAPALSASTAPDRAVRAEFDPGELLKVAGGDAALAGELAELFLAEDDEHLQRISSAIESGDSERLQFAAHALKGSAASLTARDVAVLAGRLEAMGKARDLTGAERIFTELSESMMSLAAKLHRLTVNTEAAV
jgi:HPt (histidine-containing phosphotransfer) domain-containing protein